MLLAEELLLLLLDAETQASSMVTGHAGLGGCC